MKPDYDWGDQVLFVGSGDTPPGPGPFFCTALFEDTKWPCEGCGGTSFSVISGTGGIPWCAFAWRKAPDGEEIEHKQRAVDAPVKEDA